MSRSRLGMLRILIPLVIFLFGCFTPQPPDDVVRPDRANIVVMGDAYHLAPGSVASFLVQVRDPARVPAIGQSLCRGRPP